MKQPFRHSMKGQFLGILAQMLLVEWAPRAMTPVIPSSSALGLRVRRHATPSAELSLGLGWVGLGWVGLGWVGAQPLAVVALRGHGTRPCQTPLNLTLPNVSLKAHRTGGSP